EWAAAHQFGARYAVLATLTGELDLPLQHLLPLLEPPVLLVAGEEDRQRTRHAMEDLAVLHPHADLDVIPGAGAAVFQDQPARFATARTWWMRRELPRRTGGPAVDASAPLPSATRSAASTQPASNGTSTPRAASTPQDAVELRTAPSTKHGGAAARPRPEPPAT